MPTRTSAQRIGAAAEILVRDIVGGHPKWLARGQDNDFGVDLEAELALTTAEGERLTGMLIKLQVKGSENVRRTGGKVNVSLERHYLDYVAQFRLPVILVIVDITTREAWSLWLQKWLLDNEVRLQRGAGKYVTVGVSDQATLASELDWHLPRIAMGEDEASLILALRELAITARTMDSVGILRGIFALLEEVQPSAREWTIQKTIDALIGLGPNVGVWQTQKYLAHIFALVEQFGGSFTQEQVTRLVVRNESYSRTGLYGLAALYDNWGQEAAALELAAAFRKAGHDHVAWYCEMREANPGKKSLRLWDEFPGWPAHYGDLELPRSEPYVSEIRRGWPNRGDSIYLDYLVLATPRQDVG